MREFYSKLLGAQPTNVEWADTWAFFDLGGAGFALHAIPAEYARDIEISSPPQIREQNPLKVIFEVADVPQEKKRLEALGITMLQRPWQDPAEACEGVDPEGNVFQIAAPH